MSRLIIVLLVLVAVIGGGLALLASRASERPLKPVEKVVPLAALQK